MRCYHLLGLLISFLWFRFPLSLCSAPDPPSPWISPVEPPTGHTSLSDLPPSSPHAAPPRNFPGKQPRAHPLALQAPFLEKSHHLSSHVRGAHETRWWKYSKEKIIWVLMWDALMIHSPGLFPVSSPVPHEASPPSLKTFLAPAPGISPPRRGGAEGDRRPAASPPTPSLPPGVHRTRKGVPVAAAPPQEAPHHSSSRNHGRVIGELGACWRTVSGRES